MTKGKNNITGVTGEYFVCAELGYRNILAIPTPKNNPLFDLLAADLQAERIVAIQVKTMSKGNKQGWRLNKGIIIPKNNQNLFAILVNLKNDGGGDYYIFRYDELSKKKLGKIMRTIYQQIKETVPQERMLTLGGSI